MSRSAAPLLARPEVLQVLFHPRAEPRMTRIDDTAHAVTITADDGTRLGGKVFVASATAPAILYFHGNGEIAADYDGLSSIYNQLGMTLFVADYRGYGASEGWPDGPSLLADARATWAQTPGILEGLGLAPASLHVMGRSLGSAAALEILATAETPPDGLIIESGFAHTLALIERLGGFRISGAEEARDGFGNLDKIARAKVPTVIIHGTEDWIIPVDDGRALHQAAAGAPKRLVEIPGAGHNDLMMVDQRSYFLAVRNLVVAGSV
ncbi:MAG: alpha/beta hydrolase [Rhodospirillaceae bacterium]|nr:alpha/beta hydrolase [Rhodospirillaceae bacterium]